MFDFSFKTIFLPRFILDVYTMLYKPNPPAWNRRLIRRFGTDRESLFLYMCQKLLFPGKKVSLVISKKSGFRVLPDEEKHSMLLSYSFPNQKKELLPVFLTPNQFLHLLSQLYYVSVIYTKITNCVYDGKFQFIYSLHFL